MKRKYTENDNGFKRYRSEVESKIALMSQEIERLNGIIGKKNEQIQMLGGDIQ